jgi:hypothetical protein
MDSADEDVSSHGEKVGGDDLAEGIDVEQAPTDLHTTKVVRAQFESLGIPGDSIRVGWPGEFGCRIGSLSRNRFAQSRDIVSERPALSEWLTGLERVTPRGRGDSREPRLETERRTRAGTLRWGSAALLCRGDDSQSPEPNSRIRRGVHLASGGRAIVDFETLRSRLHRSGRPSGSPAGLGYRVSRFFQSLL